jgi:indolepyruvate ferredoxin oxidoreductase
VQLNPNRFPTLTTRQQISLNTSAIDTAERVIIPPDTTRKELEVLTERHPSLIAAARRLKVNQILYPGADVQPLCFIVSGVAYTYLEHALFTLGLAGHFPILKLGLSYPLDPEILKEFAAGVRHLCVVEEKRGFIEPQVAVQLSRLRQLSQINNIQLWGKRFPGDLNGFPEVMGLNPSLMIAHLERLFPALNITHQPATAVSQTNGKALTVAVPPRTPSFCPGCPHRDSASVLKRTAHDFADPDYMAHAGHAPTDLVFHGDIGCYSMLKYAPFSRLMHNLSGMGLGGGTGAGIDPFITNKQLVFMGDSTFFHTGLTAISDSIKNNQDLTYVILDNKTTAMTGHQPTPGVDVDILGKPTFAQDIEAIVNGLAASSGILVARINPAERRQYRQLLEETILKPGVKVIIADKECGITYHRRERAIKAQRLKQHGFLPVEEHINISEDVCEYCLECTKGTGCSGLTVKETTYGPKIAIDRSSCVTDGACAKVEVADGDKTCPSFEEITIHRQAPPLADLPLIEVNDLPVAPLKPLDSVWYPYIAGVGGMGVNVVSSVLAQAGARQGYSVRLTNKKGLAIRNGSVYSHMSYTPDDTILSPLTPNGQADLLLGMDILEATRGVDPRQHNCVASAERTAAVVNTCKTPTIGTLIGEEDFSVDELTDFIRHKTRQSDFFGADLFRLSEAYLGNKLYANIMMLGAAYQRGLLPLELKNLEWALDVAIRHDLPTNMKAFNMGRQLVLDPDYFATVAPAQTYMELLVEKTKILGRTHNDRTATAYRQVIETNLAVMDLDEDTRLHFALRVYDLIQYENLEYAYDYIALVRQTYRRDGTQHHYAATAAIIRQLAKVMAIKDEIYVAYLLTCEEKYGRDRQRYNIDSARGDRIRYRHITRPHSRLFGRDFRPDLKTRDWTLRLMRRGKFLRRLFASWWHREEREFLDWYKTLANQFNFSNDAEYRTWLQVLELPDQVRGYRSVRSAKIQAAYLRPEELLQGRPPRRAPGILEIEKATPHPESPKVL